MTLLRFNSEVILNECEGTMRFVLIFIFICSLAGSIWAESFVSIEGYPVSQKEFKDYTDFEQIIPVNEPKIKEILYPVYGFAAFVSLDDPEFSVIIKAENIDKTTKCVIGKFNNDSFIPMLTVLPEKAETLEEGIIKLTFKAPVIFPSSVFDIKIVSGENEYVSKNSLSFRKDVPFSFMVYTDPQIEDLQSKKELVSSMNFNSKEYPGYSNDITDYSIQFGVIKQAFSELSISTYDATIGLGDMVFSMNYIREYSEFVSLLENLQLPLFTVPGNHDGYAKFLSENDFDSGLEFDGLNYWAKYFGPRYFSFKVNGEVFLMLNSYGGNAIRRASGRPVGIGEAAATPISNWGGFVEEEQLQFAKDTLKENNVFGIFSHQNPLGNMSKDHKYHANKEFPKDSIIGVIDAQEWNYDSEDYDCNITDSIIAETSTYNTGTRIADMMASSSTDLYFVGHTHSDRTYHFAPGDELVPDTGIKADKDIYFVEVTTAAASGDFWGMRPVKYSQNGETVIDYLCEKGAECLPDKNPKGFQSRPIGNIWAEFKWNSNDGEQSSYFRGGDGIAQDVNVSITNMLPTDEELRFRFIMPANKKGFKTDSEIYTVENVMVSDDLETSFVTVRGTAEAGNTKDTFLNKNFNKKEEAFMLTIADSAPEEPSVTYDENINEDDPFNFTVENSDEFAHLIWKRSGLTVADTPSFNIKFDDYSETENITLVYIDEKGGWGKKDFTVTVTMNPDEPDEDFNSETDDDAISSDEDSEKSDDDVSNPTIHKSSGCGCSLIF